MADATAALEGVDVAVYLVHSMLPSAHLTQGNFRDFDLICADNFGRAAARNGVRQIVYLGGIVPAAASRGHALSSHLASRLEVEHTLAASGVPVTALRAALVVGRGGSSFDILVKLVTRLPAMICPAWTLTRTQPIALSDVVALLAFCIARPETFGRVFDIAGPEIVSYREMMARTAARLGLRRRLLPLPLLTPRLSSLWVSLVSGYPRALVRPLVQSLRHEMVAGDRALNEMAGLPGLSFDQALNQVFDDPQRQIETPAVSNLRPASSPRTTARAAVVERTVRSVQRMTLPPGMTAEAVAREYLTWLPRRLAPFLQVEVDPESVRSRTCRIRLRGMSRPLLEFEFALAGIAADRTVLPILGGLLARVLTRGFLEFREVLERKFVLVAIHDFQPRLPWPIYTSTQAVLHVLVMRAFARHLRSASPA